MAREKEKKLGKEQQLLDAARLGNVEQLETILSQFRQLKSKKRSNPLASLRKASGPSNIRDPVTGFTCLHHAALNGHSRCLQLVLACPGVKLNAVDYKGSSALHLAAWAGNLQIVRLLLDHSAATWAPSRASNTNGVQQQDEDNFQELDVNLRNNDNQTPLALAAQFGHDGVVAELLRRGANVHLRNNQLESALDLACLNGRLETVRLLLDSAPQLVEQLRKPYSSAPIWPVSGACNGGPAGTNHEQELALASGERRATSSSRRQIVSGWSSLLRGHGGAKSAASDARSSSQPAWPAGWPQSRRATMSAGQFANQALIQQPQLQQHQQRARLFFAQTESCQQQHQHQQQQQQQQQHQLSFESAVSRATAATSERLLEHSPLHLAARRNHANVINLLLGQFNANLMQLTSRGSVLHEIVMSCEHSARHKTSAQSDTLNLLVTHLISRTSGNFAETKREWDRLVSVRNSQGKTIFDLLLDCEQQNAGLHAAKVAAGREIQLFLADMSRQLDNLSRTGGAHEARLAPPEERRMFATSQQINSFVTMKRAPKHQKGANCKNPLGPKQASANEGIHSVQANQPDSSWLMAQGTQTIDRRVLRQVAAGHLVGGGRPQAAFEQHAFLATNQAPGGHRDESTHLGRSMSNVVTEQQAYLLQQSADGDEPKENVPIMLRPQEGHNQNHRPNLNLNHNYDRQNMQARKSRDLSSLLFEVGQLGDDGPSGEQEQLYDNQPPPQERGCDKAGQQAGAKLCVISRGGQLVRSQTDCSHLMGKLFGPSSSQTQQLDVWHQNGDQQRWHLQQQQQQPAQSQAGQHQQRSENSSLVSVRSSTNLAPTKLAQNHSATLDRRAINRHYHVYEHEFYPPRLVSNQQQPQQPGSFAPGSQLAEANKQKQAVAIVPPFKHDQQRHLNKTSNSNHCDELQVDATVQDDNRQQEQMDRFVCRLTRKTSANNGQLSVDTSEPASVIQASQSSESHLGQQAQLSSSSSSSSSDQSHLFDSTRRALMRDFDQMLGRELLNCRDQCDMMAASASSHSILTGVSLDMDTRGERLTVSGTRVTMPIESASSQQLSSSSAASFRRNVKQSASSDSLRRAADRRHSPRDELAAAAAAATTHTDSEPSAGASAASRARPPRPALPLARPSSQTGASNSSTGCFQTTSSSGDSGCSSTSLMTMARVAPQKPPRPSLKSQQMYKSLQLAEQTSPAGQTHPSSPRQQQTEPVIYDLPSTSSPLESASAQLRSASRTSAASSSLAMTPCMQPAPSASKQAHRQHGAITQPPLERPPPPPATSQLNSPINLATHQFRHDHRQVAPTNNPNIFQPCSSMTNTTTAALSEQQKQHQQQDPSQNNQLQLRNKGSRNAATSLLKLAPFNHEPATNSCQSTSSGSPSSFSSVSLSRSIAAAAHGSQRDSSLRSGQNLSNAACANQDADSGVCTSNSPASLSHDSDGQAPAANRRHSHEAKPASLLMRLGSNCARSLSSATSCGDSTILSPPSPRTAQMSIEEALVPLEESVATQEIANQTISFEHHAEIVKGPTSNDAIERHYSVSDTLRNSAQLMRASSLSAQVDLIFGWLSPSRVSQKTIGGHDQTKDQARQSADYENCLNLQSKLKETRCRSLSNLLDVATDIGSVELKTKSSRGLSPSGSISSSPDGANNDDDDDDYAATSNANDPESSESNSLASPMDTSSEHLRSSCSGVEKVAKSCKEVTLRVVYDEAGRSASGMSDVFYIDPSELKKIANPNARSDAETLTDEELCASVDQDSGYIKFTLRKRQASMEEAGDYKDHRATDIMQEADESRQLGPVVDGGAQSSERARDEQRVPSVKRTKMVVDDGTSDRSEKCATSPKEDEKTHQEKEEETTQREMIESSVACAERPAQSMNKPQFQRARKCSADSIQMDTSQASSSSSEMSIKSIVSLRNNEQKTACDDFGSSTAATNTDLVARHDDCKLDLKPVEKEGNEQTRQCGEVTPKNSSPVSTAPRVATKSIVSETARRLEAAAAVLGDASSLKRPVAAARLSLQAGQTTRPVSMDSACRNGHEQDKENSLVQPIAAPKKTICWPPRQPSEGGHETSGRDGQVVAASTIGRVTANRLSFQKLIEESNNKSNAVLANRPKPPPPVKPAGLVASRFNAHT